MVIEINHKRLHEIHFMFGF